MTEFLERLMAGDADAILLTAAGYFILVGVFGLISMYRKSKWPSVIGQLLDEKIEGAWGGRHDETNFGAKVLYRYSVDGVTYENDQINVWHIRMTYNLRALLKWQFRFIERHGQSRVTVYYNPKRPEKAYLVVPGVKQMAFVSVLFFGAAALVLANLSFIA